MILDSTNIHALDKAAKAGEVDIGKATKIIVGFYKGLIKVISTEKTIIKIPFFGKFIYSEDWKRKKEAIRLNYKDLTILE